jgi:ketosteroid isomerase-like protein
MSSLNVIVGGPSVPSPTDPTGALIEYYRAFNDQRLQLMELNWLDSAATSINSPFGSSAQGWNGISDIYRRLFRLKAKPSLELMDYTVHVTGDTFLCIGTEIIRFRGEGATAEFRSRSSRWFTRLYGRWRQMHYHGSIDDASQLARLQSWIHGDADPVILTVDHLTLSR